jgi:hypothetical protein
LQLMHGMWIRVDNTHFVIIRLALGITVLTNNVIRRVAI